MFRLVSLLSIACLAVAAAKIASRSSAPSKSQQPQLDLRDRLPVTVRAVVRVNPTFHARFSLN